MVTQLADYTDEQLIRECLRRGYDEETYYGAVYALDAMEGHYLDQMEGYSEDGNHGKKSDEPVRVEPDESKAA